MSDLPVIPTCNLCGFPIVHAQAEDGKLVALDVVPTRLWRVEGTAEPTMPRLTGYTLGHSGHRYTCRGYLLAPTSMAEHLARFGLELAAIGALALYCEHAASHYTSGNHVDAFEHQPPAHHFRTLGRVFAVSEGGA